ncbi:MAG: type 4a pilus biogenesis protein PilO [Phycisphaerae bacterium]|nr:type 4a pilus biogenesis protein PilO [Phycisphaerae bacterium]
MKFGLRELVFVAMLLAVPVGLYMYVLKPRKLDKEKMVAETRDKSKQLQKMKLVRSQADQKIREDIKFLEKALETIRIRQPVAEDTVTTRSALREIALKKNLTISTLKPRPISTSEPKEKQYNARGMTIGASGTYHDIYAFLLAVENDPRRVIRINRVTIESDARDKKGLVGAIFSMAVLSPKTKDQKK